MADRVDRHSPKTIKGKKKPASPKAPPPMQKIQLSLLLFLLLTTLKANASRSLYVDDFATILGNISSENALLSYAQTHKIETLLLYELHLVNATHNLPNPATNQVLATFISKAKTTYGVLFVGAIAENGSFFTNVIDAYNNSRSNPLEKFDIYNLEFEYWVSAATGPGGYYCNTYLTPNGLPCTEHGAFQYYISILKTMDTLASNNAHPITTEAYVGWPTAGQADTIGANLDRLRLHAYVSSPSTAFTYSNNRLIDFANGTPGLAVSIIFSAEPVFMQNWLLNNSMLEAENMFTSDWANGSSGWPNHVNIEGFTYFTYTDMINVPLPLEQGHASQEEHKATSIYPTLAQDLINITSTEEIDQICIYDIHGRRIKEIIVVDPNMDKVDINDLRSGVYLLFLKSDDRLESFRFVKQN